MEKESGNFYIFGPVVLENPRYVFAPFPMTTAVFDAIVPCFTTREDDSYVVGTFEHYNDDFMYEVPGGTYQLSAKVLALSNRFFRDFPDNTKQIGTFMPHEHVLSTI